MTIELTWLSEHRLDRTALSLRVEGPPADTLPLVAATHSVLGDVSGLVSTADSSYAVLDRDEGIDLVFGAPASPPTGRRRYALLSKGYYLLFAGKQASGENTLDSGLPARLRLHTASPNPMAAASRFRYELPRPSRVRLRIYDVTGRVVATLFDGVRPAGYHSEAWDGSSSQGRSVGAGIYFARIEVEGESQTAKFVLLK